MSKGRLSRLFALALSDSRISTCAASGVVWRGESTGAGSVGREHFCVTRCETEVHIQVKWVSRCCRQGREECGLYGCHDALNAPTELKQTSATKTSVISDDAPTLTQAQFAGAKFQVKGKVATRAEWQDAARVLVGEDLQANLLTIVGTKHIS